ncbi:hypothetical protein DSO57_1021449 [Entomophthora muscae]|uniref:Uncharacterized protein n=1 Tax=Entomophthora muscae TaxID=34485 RepID=A0ACC2SSJ2_9FUNG|nr:hypothetical protein DSO57_1021449 [Entomophthora muscae]
MSPSSSQPLAMTQDTLWGLVKRNPTMASTDISTHGPDQASQASDKPSPEDTQHWGHPLEYKYPVPTEIQGILFVPLHFSLLGFSCSLTPLEEYQYWSSAIVVAVQGQSATRKSPSSYQGQVARLTWPRDLPGRITRAWETIKVDPYCYAPAASFTQASPKLACQKPGTVLGGEGVIFRY